MHDPGSIKSSGVPRAFAPEDGGCAGHNQA